MLLLRVTPRAKMVQQISSNAPCTAQATPWEGVAGMSVQYIVNEAGERISVILPLAEYVAILERLQAVQQDETDYLLSSPEQAQILRERLEDLKSGRRIIERELLLDES
jgi:PHD/YefM family antitoxin component YafN of YafNO toxin-antitoxin module